MAQYPNKILKEGVTDAAVLAVRAELAGRGYVVEASGDYYDDELASAVSLFQAQSVDLSDRPLRVDSEVGPNTWGALFGTLPTSTDAIALRALQFAVHQIGEREEPAGSNKGPMVSEYLKEAGISPGHPWCMAFVYWCLVQASGGREACPMPRSAGVLDVYRQVKNTNRERIIPKSEVLKDPTIVQPGWIFIQDHDRGQGHTGFVKSSRSGALVTIEGNTNTKAGREGVGVFELNRRSVTDDQLVCFIDFGR